MSSDFFYVFKWWLFLFGIGLLFFPLSKLIFARFFDKGYIFSKTIGIAIISYLIFIFGTFHILPFNRISIMVVLLLVAIFDIYILRKFKHKLSLKGIRVFVFQEIFFFLSLLLWSYIKSFQADIHGLEKFMDFGFMNSILRSMYFPPTDMWFPPFSINYYYFGHLVTAVLIKLTNISPFIAFNLMLATIFAFTMTCAFSILSTLTQDVLKIRRTSFMTGLLGAVLVTLGGNLHTIYAFFVPYNPPESPVPFWQLKFNLGQILNTKGWSGIIVDGFPNNYWYPNATRFIPFTIHEFPSYSFVVSDLHGHVLDIPFVFLTLALIYSIFLEKKITYRISLAIAFMLAVMYMTNAWDGIIYLLLFIFTVLLWKSDILGQKKITKKIRWFNFIGKIKTIKNKTKYLFSCTKYVIFIGFSYFIFSFPFNLHFKPFVSGIGVVCSPSFLVGLKKLGPFIFEPNHCQRSPFWMLVILYGFFYFFAIPLVLKILKLKKTSPSLIYVLLLILLSTILIATPEFIYAKDIYPAHYRANTMFKLGYQAFIMLSLVSSFSIAYLFHKGRRVIWLPITFILLGLVLMYPYFSINSYFGNLKEYKGLNGLSYLKTLYPQDYEAIYWIQKNINGQPVILEAQGDSYTDFERISANTGLPTPLGWTVHEWLWRGNYSFPQSRLDDIKLLYEGDIAKTKSLIKKYNIQYVYVGEMERTKYTNLNEEKFLQLGEVVFRKGRTSLYKITSM